MGVFADEVESVVQLQNSHNTRLATFKEMKQESYEYYNGF
jgi:hypothetical protein